ncbi:hypothetical protein ACU6U9_06735 [Pseudomonas sp. HK3]|jgi:hypothetical protein
MRYFLLLMCFQLSFLCQAENNNWFQYNQTTQTYSIDAENIHPAAFFKQLSTHSGIEIRFDQHLSVPINYYTKNSQQSHVIRYLEKEFSTLLTFKKNTENQEILTLISILPKGKFTSSRMISAVDPIEEAINFQNKTISSIAKSVYLTRMDHLETKVRENLEHQAELTIRKREQRINRIRESKLKKKALTQTRMAELEGLRNTDPKLYAAQKAIYFPKSIKKE